MNIVLIILIMLGDGAGVGAMLNGICAEDETGVAATLNGARAGVGV